MPTPIKSMFYIWFPGTFWISFFHCFVPKWNLDIIDRWVFNNHSYIWCVPLEIQRTILIIHILEKVHVKRLAEMLGIQQHLPSFWSFALSLLEFFLLIRHFILFCSLAFKDFCNIVNILLYSPTFLLLDIAETCGVFCRW